MDRNADSQILTHLKFDTLLNYGLGLMLKIPLAFSCINL